MSTLIKLKKGKEFGRLTVIKRKGTSSRGEALWECVCTCENIVVKTGSSLRSGDCKSCGCLLENREPRKYKHSIKEHLSEYGAYKNMIDRCNNPENKHYIDYGGRGICVCKRWLKSFDNFIEDVGKKPSPEYTLGRIENDGNYEPENVEWQTREEQSRNTRRNRLLTYKGETLCMMEWSKRTGIPFNKIWFRITVQKWSAKKTLSTYGSIKRGNRILYRGKKRRVLDLANEHDIDPMTLYGRLYDG